MNLKLLAEPFAANEIEWRVGQAGQKGDEVWAKVLAYVTNRAIMGRLDEVCGPENWRNEFRYEAGGAILCGISIKVVNLGDPEWVTKWDGAEATDIEAVKGGLSNAMKRAAVQWGIGRYLYDLEEGWAKVHDKGAHFQAKKDGKYPAFKWDPPALPKWALPEGTPEPVRPTPATDRARARIATQPGQGDTEAVAGASMAIQAALSHVVRGKPLSEYDTEALYGMQKNLKKENKPEHKLLLADVTTVLEQRARDRVATKPAPAPLPKPLSDEQRGELVKNADADTGKPSAELPFD